MIVEESCFEFYTPVQHIRKYLQELLSLISELWSSFSFPATSRPSLGYPVSFGLLGHFHVLLLYLCFLLVFLLQL